MTIDTQAEAVASAGARAGRSRRYRRVLMGLLVSGASLAVSLLAAEVALRLVWDRVEVPAVMQGFDGATFYQRDAELGAIPRPNVAGVHQGFNAAFTTNGRGLRGADSTFTIPKPAGVRRVVVIGDSFAWGYGVEDGEIFTEIIERRMPGVEVVNLGVISFDLRDELSYLEREGMRYEPDVVLLAVCQNDIRLHRQRKAPVADTGSPAARASVVEEGGLTAALRGVKGFLCDHSRLYAFTQQSVNSSKTLTSIAVSLGLKEGLAGLDKLDVNVRAALREYPEPVERAMRQYQRELLTLRDSLASRNIRLVVALIPALQSVHEEALKSSIAYTIYDVDDFDIAKPYHLLAEFCQANGIEAVNPFDDFKARTDAGETLYLPHDMHFNAAGHQLFAETIIPELRACLSE